MAGMWTREGSTGAVNYLLARRRRFVIVLVIVVGTWWADESGGVPGTALLRDVKPALSSYGHDSPDTPTSSTAICLTGAWPSPWGFRPLRPKERIPPPRSDHTLGSRGRPVRQDPSTPRESPNGEGDPLRVLPPAWPEDSQRPPKALSGT